MLLTDLLPQLLPDVVGCPDVVAVNALRNAAIEFCTETRVWVQDLAPIALTDGQASYAVAAPTDSRIVAVSSVRNPLRRMVPKTELQLDRDSVGWRLCIGSLPNFYVVARDNSAVIVVPTPQSAAGNSITVQLVLAPTVAAASIPDDLANEYFETLLAGAKKRLLLIPERAWTNPQLATVWGNQFVLDMDKARIKMLYGNGDTTLVVSARPFGL